MNKTFEMPTVSVVFLNGADIICSSTCQTGQGGNNEQQIL